MGGLGFGLPAAIGVRMAAAGPPGRRGRRRRVVALRHPGAVERRALRLGVLFVVLANGRYAVMDRLAEQHGAGKAPWPAFEEVSISRLADGLGCPATRVADPRRAAEGARRRRADAGGADRAAGARGPGRTRHHVRPVTVPTVHDGVAGSAEAGRSVLGRALAVLDTFSNERPEQTLGAICAATGLPSATTHRLVNELVDVGSAGARRPGPLPDRAAAVATRVARPIGAHPARRGAGVPPRPAGGHPRGRPPRRPGRRQGALPGTAHGPARGARPVPGGQAATPARHRAGQDPARPRARRRRRAGPRRPAAPAGPQHHHRPGRAARHAHRHPRVRLLHLPRGDDGRRLVGRGAGPRAER